MLPAMRDALTKLETTVLATVATRCLDPQDGMKSIGRASSPERTVDGGRDASGYLIPRDVAIPGHCAAGAAAGTGCSVIVAPTSFSSCLKSGESRTIFRAAARSRSTASGGSTNDVGRSFR